MFPYMPTDRRGDHDMGGSTHRPVRATHRLRGDPHMQIAHLYTHDRYGIVLVTGIEFNSQAYSSDTLYKVSIYILNEDRHTYGLFARADWLKLFKPHTGAQ